MPAGLHNCAHCRSAEVIAGVATIQCLACGKHTFFTGEPAPDGLVVTSPPADGAVQHAEAIVAATSPAPKSKAAKK